MRSMTPAAPAMPGTCRACVAAPYALFLRFSWNHEKRLTGNSIAAICRCVGRIFNFHIMPPWGRIIVEMFPHCGNVRLQAAFLAECISTHFAL